MNETQKKIVNDIHDGTIKTVGMEHKFKFNCTSCGKCCFNNDIIINSYDMIRLRRALGKTTREILDGNYLELYIGPVSGLPIAKIKFEKFAGELTKCPFLTPAFDMNSVIAHLKNVAGGDEKKFKELADAYKKDPAKFKEDLQGITIDRWLCSIHEHRPIICRLFPCGRIQQVDIEKETIEEKYVLQDTEKDREFCPGWGSQTEITVKDYLTSQHFWHFREGSAKFTELLNILGKNGFISRTKENENNEIKPLFEPASREMILIGNILYNFDDLPPFSNDPRVRATITDKVVSQEDYMYVMDSVVAALAGVVNGIKLIQEKEVNNNNDKNN